jgi:4-amino-4-deoxy-L-arabinose transferase-like glycosyltransferase
MNYSVVADDKNADVANQNYSYYLFAFTLLLFFTGIGDRDFWAPVEPRYGEIIRIMFAKGEWIVPTVNGDLYTDKPIFYFWLALIASKIAGGVSEWAVRLPAALGGIGFVLATYFTGRDFFSPKVGLVAGAVLATSVRVIWEARWTHIDMLFGCFFLLTIYFGARSLIGKGGKREILWAHVFMGLAVLTKGLIGMVLPALLLGAFAIARRDWRLLVHVKLQFGIPIFLLIVAPWFYLVNSATDGKWLADFIYIHHLQRYTEGIGHRQPAYYYLTTLPVDFMPWTVFAIPAMAAYFPYRRLMQRPTPLFFSLCFLVVFGFFSISDTKRDLYLLPLMPTLALLVGNYIVDLSENRMDESPLHQWLSQCFFGAAVLFGLAVPLLAWLIRREIFWISLPLALVLVIGGTMTLLFIRRRRPLEVVTAVALLMGCVALGASTRILPYVNHFKSPRPFSMQVKRIVPATSPLYIYSDRMNDFNFYTERENIPVLSSPSELKKVREQAGAGYLLIKQRDLKLLSELRRERVVARDSVGRETWNLITLEAAMAVEMPPDHGVD